jgi:hypothetical protein
VRDHRHGAGPDWWRSWGPDALIAVTLIVVAFIARRDGLPTDGLWHDDAWVVFAATKGSLSHLFTIGADHPGFTLLLMAWTRLGGTIESTSYPAFIAGTLGPPALYLVLRRLGFARSISVLLGATLAAANIHIMYSGRVKTYTLDVLIVLGLVVAVAGLANITWRWPTAVTWIIAVALLSSLSGFALLATAAAGIVLLLHPASDRRMRVVAVGAGAAVQLLLFTAVQRSYDAHELEVFWSRAYDSYLDFDINPIRFGSELLEHLSRVAHVFPADSGWWPTLCVIVALLGLLAAALTGRLPPGAVRARYLLIVFLVAFLGGLLDKVPFGPARGGDALGPATLSRGERASLWLIPMVAIGLAVGIQTLRRFADDWRSLRVSFDALLYLLAAVVLIAAVGHDAPPYAFLGSRSAVKFVESELGKDDALLVMQGGHYQLALESNLDVSLQARPKESIGFVPEFADPRVHVAKFAFGHPISASMLERTREAINGVHRVIVYSGSHIFTVQFLFAQEAVLRNQGFRKQRTVDFGGEQVWIWERSH